MGKLPTPTITLLLALLGMTTGCSVALDFTECTNNDDCAALAASGETLVCVDNTCVSGQECQSDNDCADKAPRTSCVSGACVEPDATNPDDTSEPDTSDTSDVPIVPDVCTQHSQCSPLGDEAICSVGGTCVSATTEQCHTVTFPDGDRDQVVFLGSIIPTSPPFDALALPLERSVQLAVEDFNRTGGLPGGRKIAWVACDSMGSSELAQAAATHLVDNVGVPAIIGPVLSTAFIDVTTNITANAGVLTISPSATSSAITALDDDGLAWRVIPSDVYQSSAIADRVIDLGAPKVVVLAKNDAYGSGLLTEVSVKLTAALGSENLYVANYEDPVKIGDVDLITDELSRVAGLAIGNAPDAAAVVLLGTSEAIDLSIIHLVGLQSAGVVPANDPPEYIFSHGAVPSLTSVISHPGNFLGDYLLGFVEGISPNVFDPENYAAFDIRYRARFLDEDPVTSRSLAYDATLVVLFAMSGLEQDAEITGTDVAAGIGSLVDKEAGTPVSFGDSNFINTGRNILAEGGTVDLKGVSGDLDFNLDTGEVRTNYLGWELEKVLGDYVPNVARVYVLDPEPATDGVWVDNP